MSERPSPDEQQHLWDKPKNVNRLLTVFYLLCLLLVGLEFLVQREVHHSWEYFFGFHAFYGFVACWTLVVVAKGMRRVLMRREDYYDVD
jgi:hypothetical protein